MASQMLLQIIERLVEEALNDVRVIDDFIRAVKEIDEDWQAAKRLEIINPASSLPGPYSIEKVFSGDSGLDEFKKYLLEKLAEKAKSLGIRLDVFRQQPAVSDRRIHLDENPERAAKQIRLKFGRNYCKDLFFYLQKEWIKTM